MALEPASKQIGRSTAFLFSVILWVGFAAPAVHAHPGPGLVVDRQGRVYFIDYTRNRIMKISTDGKLSVFADGSAGEKFLVPHHLALDRDGNVYTASDRGGKVCRISPEGNITQIYPPADWYGIDFTGFGGDPFAIDAQGNIYCLNYRQDRYCQILKITAKGLILNLAGGELGQADGQGAAAKFSYLHNSAFVCGPDGCLYVSDGGAIRKVQPDGAVSTFAGGARGGFADGRGAAAKFGYILGLNFDARGNLWAADTGNGRIRKIAPDGTVTTLDVQARRDGKEVQYVFEQLAGVAAGPAEDVYALDYPEGDDPRVSRIAKDGTVTTLAKVK